MKTFINVLTWLFRRPIVMLLTVALLPISAAAFQPQGLYLMTRIFGSSIEMRTWYFRGNQFAENPVGDIGRFDFGAAERAAPGSTGSFSAAGDQWTFRWIDGRDQTARYESGRTAGSCFYWNAGLFCPVKPFAIGQIIDGVYSGSLGGGGVGSSRSYRFLRDGTYVIDRAGSVSSSGAYAGQSSQERGRYRISGNLLSLQPEGGMAVALTTFPYETTADPARPDRFYAGGFMLKRVGDNAGGSPTPATTRAAVNASTPNDLEACPDRLPSGTVTLDCVCTAESAASGGVWGSDVYTADSRVCRAALHAGAMGESGGKVRIRTVPGDSSYSGTTRNGVTTSSWGSYPQGFVVSKR